MELLASFLYNQQNGAEGSAVAPSQEALNLQVMLNYAAARDSDTGSDTVSHWGYTGFSFFI